MIESITNLDVMAQPFLIELAVRDYELDMQGVVNNAVYQNYLEHARHTFLKANGLNFAEITRAGVNLVIIRAELDYISSLRSGDSFTVSVRMQRVSRLRFSFDQEIRTHPEGRVVMRATLVGTGLDQRGRPKLSPELEQLLVSCSS